MPILIQENNRKQEQLNGIIYNMSPSADYRHGTINLNIYYSIRKSLKNSLCSVFVENIDFIINDDGDYAIPDVIVLCDKKNLKRGSYYGTPKLAVETLSPSTALKDRTVKKDCYAKKGIEEYWIIDPKALSLEIYYLTSEENYELNQALILERDKESKDYNAETVITLRTIPTVSMTLEEIFEGVE